MIAAASFRVGPGGAVSLAIAGVAAIACGESPSSGGGTTVRDSAGVMIVESDRAAWTPGTAWRVSPEPTLVIGSAEASPEFQLYEVGDVLRLPDGRLVVENAGTELLFFDAEGAFLQTVGREGDGPGEFSALNGLALLGDTLIVYDAGHGRASFLDFSGQLIDDVALKPTGSEMDVWSYALAGVIGDALLLETWVFDAGMRDPPAVYWDSLPNLLYGLDGDRRPFGPYGGLEIYSDGGASTYLPFGRMTSSDVGPDGLYTGDGSWTGYEVYGADGRLRRIVRGPDARRRVDEALLEEFVLGPFREAIAGLGDEATRNEEIAFYENMPYPDRVPAFSDLVVDTAGRVWMQEYRYRRMRGPTAWSVFDVDGAFLGTMELPRRVRVDWIGEVEILGTWTDELGVEFILAYDVIRPPGP